MKLTLSIAAIALLFASLGAAQNAPAPPAAPAQPEGELPGSAARAAAREEAMTRGRALGVNLLRWDAATPEGGWTRWAPRPDVSPGFSVDRREGARGVPGLRLAGLGKRFVYGGWRMPLSGIEEGKAYRFLVRADVKGIPSVRRGILCRITWTGSDMPDDVMPVCINDYKRAQGYGVVFDQTFTAPDRATGAQVDLFVQWVPGADVLFREFSLEIARPEAARPTKIATLYWRPSEASTPAKNAEAFAALIDKIGPSRPDVILLPEAVNFIGCGTTVPQAAAKLPDDVFLALSAKAREYKCHIIYGAYEREGDACYNSAFIIDRIGQLAGAYRKVQLPESEVDAGLSPGDFFRTFQLDFGKIGILICHDTAFPESVRVEMLDGAEIIFVPIWGGDMTQLKARAMDNAVWIVTSGYDVPSMVINPNGEVCTLTWRELGDGTAMYTVDLSKRFRRPWIGDWRNQVIRQRRTDSYLKTIEE